MTSTLVIGGGIGGLTAALTLERIGRAPIVFESRKGPDEYAGLFLNLASNGLAALRGVGVDVAGIVDAAPIPRMIMRSGAGRHLGEVANGLTLEDGTRSLCVRRSDVQRVLREAVMARDIEIRYDHRLAGVREEGNAVTATWADGSTTTADLLIGADGTWSTVRRLIAPAAPRPIYIGLVSIGGYATGTDLEPEDGIQNFIFGRDAFFGYLVRPDRSVWWFANQQVATEPDRRQLRLRQVRAWLDELSDLFAPDDPVIEHILQKTTGDVGAYAIHELPTGKTWANGRIALLGDAVHATSPSAGQGAAMAVEDALVLAAALARHGDHESAFASYAAERRPRVEKVLAYSRRTSSTKTAGPLGRRFRDLLMPVALRLFANESKLAWLYAHEIAWPPGDIAPTPAESRRR